MITQKSIDSLGYIQFYLSYNSKIIFFELFWEDFLHMSLKILIKFVKKFPIILDYSMAQNICIFYDSETNKIFFR